MLILAKPKIGKTNNRNNILYKEIENITSTEVKNFSIYNLISKRYKIFHMHWPERSIYDNNLFSYIKLLLLACLFLYLKKLNTKIIYTCHNPVFKINIKDKYKSLFYKILVSNISGIIFPSHHSKDLFTSSIEKYGLNYKKEMIIIPLGIQHTLFKKSPKRPTELNPKINNYLLLLGRISKEKSFDVTLKKLINNNKLENFNFVIAGSPIDEDQVSTLKDIHKRYPKRIHLIPRYLLDNEVNYLIKNCFSVILDYKIANSGVATLCIPFNKYIACSDKEFIKSFKSQYSYEKLINIDDLHNIHQVSEFKLQDTLEFSMMNVAKKTLNFYERVLKC